MRRAGALSDEIFAALARELSPGGSERELAWWIERSFREAGAEGIAFEPSSLPARRRSPHAVPVTGYRAGRPRAIDAGCVVDGYCSDCTRTFAVGEVSPRLAELHALCLQAQLAGLDAVAPGVHGRDADAPRDLIDEAGLGAAYGHGMGHGVGLQVHEAPRFGPSRPTPRDGQRRLGRAGITSRTRVQACGSRISCSSPTTAASGSRSSRRSC